MPNPKPISATPTLVGLRPAAGTLQPDIAAVYPWRQLEWIPSDGSVASWRVRDEDGGAVLQEGHPLVLIVRGKRAVRVAQLAEQRVFRNAWASGHAHVRVDRISRAEGWSFLGFTTFFSAVAVPLWLKVVLECRAWHEYAALTPQARAAVLIVGGLWISFLIVPLLGVVLGGLALRRSQIASVSFDRRGIKARLRCGADLEVEWQDVCDLRLAKVVRVQLRDGQTVWLGPLPDGVRTKLRWIRDERFPQSVIREKRRNRRINSIVLALSLAAAIGTGLAVGYLGQEPGQPAIFARFVAPVLTCVGLISAVFLFADVYVTTKLNPKRRRRKWSRLFSPACGGRRTSRRGCCR